jgi:D-alanyl-D-alanine dipeptidase
MISRTRSNELKTRGYSLKLTALLSLLLMIGGASAAHLTSKQTPQAPPQEQGPFRKPDLVELIKLDPTIRLDIRYATANNFLGRAVYTEARAFLQRPAAEALVRAHRALRKQGYGLIIHDGYRPWAVTKIFWDATPEDKKEFVADPAKGSRHNRGCAVDLSMVELKTGKVVEMPSAYDEMSERSHINYAGGSNESRRLREILRAAMEGEGFAVYEPEWWHYDYKDWKLYPILDRPFADLGPAAKRKAH